MVTVGLLEAMLLPSSIWLQCLKELSLKDEHLIKASLTP